MSPMTAVVADDEPLARAHLRILLDEQAVETVGEAGNTAEALRMAEDLRPDILFLDIQMPGLTGLQAATALLHMDHPPLLVFVTGYSQHAVAAFEHNALDYLLKPVSADRISKTLVRARARLAECCRLIVEKRPAAAPGGAPPGTADLELQLLLDAVNRTSGYDFREYTPSLLKRRVSERTRAEGAATISGLQERVLHEDGALDRFVDGISFNPSSPFREPEFFADFRERVLPRLRTYPHIRIWVSGCGAADDAYALSILLREADLGHRSRIYATDTCELAMTRARSGILVASDMEEYEHLYRQGGGKRLDSF